MGLIPDDLWEGLAASIRESIWIYPFLETAHVIGLALVVGSIVSFDLRILGLNRDLAVRQLSRHLLPWVWTGFFINAATGVLLFISDAAEFAASRALQVKLLLILAAGLNAAVFQGRLIRTVERWDTRERAPAGARASAALSVTLWLAIVVARRTIAYIK